MSFCARTEEYYKRFIELQEKLRKSEEERLKLEMKFNEMMRITREEEQRHYKKLRHQYERFLEEDRRRQDRNERIFRALEKIENRVATLVAKTERFKLFKHQYHAFLDRIYQAPLVKSAEEKKDAAKDTGQINSAKTEERNEIIQKYLQNQSLLGKGDNASSNSASIISEDRIYKGDYRPNYSTSIAEDIMGSIYSRNVQRHNQYQDVPSNQINIPYEDKRIMSEDSAAVGDTSETGQSDNESVLYVEPRKSFIPNKKDISINNQSNLATAGISEDRFEVDDTQLHLQSSKDYEIAKELLTSLDTLKVDDQKEPDSYQTPLSDSHSYEQIPKQVISNSKEILQPDENLSISDQLTERQDYQALEKEVADIDYQRATPENQEEEIVPTEQIPRLTEDQKIEEQEQHEESIHQLADHEINQQQQQHEYRTEDLIEQQLQNQLEQTELISNQNRQDLTEDQVYEQTQSYQSELNEVHGEATDLDIDQQQLTDQKYDESETSHVQESINNQPDACAPDKQYQDPNEYYSNDQQYDDNGQPIEGAGYQQYYDENGQPIEQYDQYGQIIQYDEQGQPIQQYYDDNQEYQQEYPQYDENGQLITQGYEESSNQQYVEYDQNPQQEIDQQYTEYEQTGEGIAEQQYAEESQPINQENSGDINQPDQVPCGEEENDKSASDGKIMEMLDTDTESAKQETKVSNDSDFDFSNA